MFRAYCVCWLAVLLFGCGGPSAKDKYDEAVRDLERAQSRLDNLRPAYDAARQTAANAVCREIAGTTPDESASAALAGLGDVLNGTAAPPAGPAIKEGDQAKNPAAKKKDELDTTIDNLIAAEKNVQEKGAALTAPVAKAREVMAKIHTPGTPEAQQFEEKLAAMEEVKAYERQKNRVEKAKQAVEEAEAELDK
ncbi:MAG: hypothetical protein U0805_21640 [Pirellulales bacterium]